MIKITEPLKCTGCKMCASVCPKQAISYLINKEGFWYPVIDQNLCIDCGKCEKFCPQNIPYFSKNKEPKVYYAWNRNDDVRRISSSGGIFFTLAQKILQENGCVIGCQYGENNRMVFHSIIEEECDLYKLTGTKYLQSDLANIYPKVIKILKSGKKVLFCGTPCQIDALYIYLGREYDNLLTMDLICMGVNSPGAFGEYISEKEQEYHSRVTLVQFRSKKQSWESFATYMEFENGKVYLADKDNDIWTEGFIKGMLFMRPSCYQCKYRKIPRIADITVGDFWGNKYAGTQNEQKGISAVLVNSIKGERLFKAVKDDLYFKESCYEYLKSGNLALETDSAWTCERDKFFELLGKYPFSVAVEKCRKNILVKQENVGSDFINEKIDYGRKMSEFYHLLIQWLAVKQEGQDIAEYFRIHGYKTVAIYGMKELGERLYAELEGTDIKVKFGIDKNITQIMYKLKIVQISDIKEKVDVIVVTAIHYFDEIVAELSEIVKCPIISLEEVVYYF